MGLRRAGRGRRHPARGGGLTRGERLRLLLETVGEALEPAALRRRGQEIERRLGITRPGQLAFLAAVGIWVVARIVAGTAMYLFAYGVVLLVVVSYLITPKRLRLEGVRAGLFPRAQEGDRLQVELRLRARRRLSTFVVEERLPERLGRPVRVPITKLSSGGEVTHSYGIRCSRRGVYQVGPLVAIASDPLGLTRRESVIAEPFELLVHPRVEFVSDRPLTRQFEDPPLRPPVSKPWPSGLEFYGMRDYVPGDDLRRIVWRATARTGRVMVREAEQGITDKMTLIIDTNRASYVRDAPGLSEAFETGVRACASLAVRHLREGYEVKVLANGGPVTRALRGQGAQLMVLDALARLEMERQPLGRAILYLLAQGRRDAHNILITPKLGPEEAAQLKLLLRTGASVLVVALLWDEGSAETLGTAAALGCQVAAVHPGQDLTTALYADIGAGNRI